LAEVVAEHLEVLEAPFPLGYPSTNPQKNRVIHTLYRGDRFYYCGEEVDKDFGYYTVRLLNGQKGYIIGDSRLGTMFRMVKSDRKP
jgi:hypothetical protein